MLLHHVKTRQINCRPLRAYWSFHLPTDGCNWAGAKLYAIWSRFKVFLL